MHDQFGEQLTALGLGQAPGRARSADLRQMAGWKIQQLDRDVDRRLGTRPPLDDLDSRRPRQPSRTSRRVGIPRRPPPLD
jgi:hypothetical protein